MPHINKLIDFVVAVYIVHDRKVLLVDHKQLLRWMPIGGHIELDEDPEEALFREVKEECGLEIEVAGIKPAINEEGTKALLPPMYLDIHDIKLPHRHVGLVYFAQAKSGEVSLAAAEHNDIRWFAKEELSDPQYAIGEYVRYYAERAIEHFL
jgi:8-oxo-dGTP pyrophosphatase MutT (NUDIX family)